MDHSQNARLLQRAKQAGAITTVDVFAGSQADMPAMARVLPYTDYFMPSIEEAMALTGGTDPAVMAGQLF
jgi:sugar/nucleoside kinase (ribokinase family)